MTNHWVRWLARNLAGYSLVVVGVLLSFPGIPGPGNAIVLVGLALADWPGKRRFFRWLRTFSWFDKVDDWIHQRMKIRLPEHPSERLDEPSESACDPPAKAS